MLSATHFGTNYAHCICRTLLILLLFVASNWEGVTFKNSTWCSLCVECFVRISEQTATFAISVINQLVFITLVESVYWTVWTDSLYKPDHISSLKGYYLQWIYFSRTKTNDYFADSTFLILCLADCMRWRFWRSLVP
jgi:hypothetical protein